MLNKIPTTRIFAFVLRASSMQFGVCLSGGVRNPLGICVHVTKSKDIQAK